MVARTCSEPGVISSCVLARRPWPTAWRAIDAARVMSSYDELVHEPMSAEEISVGTPFSRAHAPTSLTSCARSGVSGPLMSGSSVERSISMTWSKNRAGSASTSGSARRSAATALAASASSSRRVAFR